MPKPNPLLNRRFALICSPLYSERAAFSPRLMAAKPFVRRFERAIELQAALDSLDALPLGEARSAKVTELFAIFEEDHIPKILEECRNAL